MWAFLLDRFQHIAIGVFPGTARPARVPRAPSRHRRRARRRAPARRGCRRSSDRAPASDVAAHRASSQSPTSRAARAIASSANSVCVQASGPGASAQLLHGLLQQRSALVPLPGPQEELALQLRSGVATSPAPSARRASAERRVRFVGRRLNCPSASRACPAAHVPSPDERRSMRRHDVRGRGERVVGAAARDAGTPATRAC